MSLFSEDVPKCSAAMCKRYATRMSPEAKPVCGPCYRERYEETETEDEPEGQR